MTRGIDIHPVYQHDITSWAAIKNRADIDWVYVKVSDGGAPYTFTDEAGVRYLPETQVRGVKSVGLPLGVYHYAQFGDAVRQADVLLREHRRFGGVLPPMLDLEAPFTPNDHAKDFGIRFCRRVKEFHRPAVYMSASMAGVLRPDRWDIPGLLIWIAAYGTNTGRRYDPDVDPGKVRDHYTGRYDIHQHTSTARIAGCANKVDLNWSLTNIAMEDEMNEQQFKVLVETQRRVSNTFAVAVENQRRITAGNAAIAALSGLLAHNADGLTADQVSAAVETGVTKALAESTVPVDADVAGAGGS